MRPKRSEPLNKVRAADAPERRGENKCDPGFGDKRLADVQFAASLAAAFEAGHVRDSAPLRRAAPSRPGLARVTRRPFPYNEAELIGSRAESLNHLDQTGFPSYSMEQEARTQVQRGKVAGYSVRTERWRYTEWAGERGGVVGAELSDRRRDSHESHHVARRPGNQQVVASLRARLKADTRRELSKQ